MVPIPKMVHLKDSELHVSDYQIPKTTDLAGMEGLPNLLLRLWRDSHFYLRNSENEANWLVLL